MSDNLDEILILTTGGTIDKRYFDALSEYQIGETVVGRLLELGRVFYAFDVRELMRKDSLDLDDSDRAQIVAAVKSSPASRIIITHGTDTMVQTAISLSQICSKTIVLVGALAPALFAESDAAFNMGMAIATAQIAPHGVYITMNGTVFNALEVRKDRELGRFVEGANALEAL